MLIKPQLTRKYMLSDSTSDPNAQTSELKTTSLLLKPHRTCSMTNTVSNDLVEMAHQVNRFATAHMFGRS